MADRNDNPKDQRAQSVAIDRPRISSRKLFAAQKEVVIEHQGEEYRLRITSNGKLILTK